ncbi:hypothetical protein DFH94DRAFT_164040 [Russula ochroleuca]|jgi:hypothetical protein|uniref:Gag protein n=1 Tax=Russula ochroleuca TaxID=152965 RepID=A0A9P5N4G0_9AGAM|nr:hypothetical protein DFH94DRAFT_164040 [Russula ochroleuca]
MASNNTPGATPNLNDPPQGSSGPGNNFINPPSPTLSGNPGNDPAVALGPRDIRIIERVLSDTSWPKDLTLDHEEYNWQEWYRRTTNLVYRQGFTPWLDGSLECPDEQHYPEAHWIWQQNDRSLRLFLLTHISSLDLTLVRNLPNSHEIFEALRKRHKSLEPFAQLALLKKALDVTFDFSTTPVSTTIAQLRDLHRRIIAMGELDGDRLLTIILINSLSDQFGHLLPAIQTISSAPDFSSKSIMRIIEGEAFLIRCRAEQGFRPSTVNPTASAVNARQPKPPCSNCKRTNHSTEFCISSGGKMAGRSIYDARAAQRVASGKAPRTSKGRKTKNGTSAPQIAHVTSQNSLTTSNSAPKPLPQNQSIPHFIIIDGVQYIPGPPNPS